MSEDVVTAQQAGLTPHQVCLSPHTGRLKKPKITWHPGLAKDGICRVNLTCSVEDSGHNVTYRWAPLQKGTFESQEGPHLNVSWTRGANHPNITCIASNPVSSSSQQFLPGDICPGYRLSLLSQTSGTGTLVSKCSQSEWFFMKCSERVWTRVDKSRTFQQKYNGSPSCHSHFLIATLDKVKRSK